MVVLIPNKGFSPGLKAKDSAIDAETINQNNTTRENVRETGIYLVWFQPGQFYSGTFVSVLSVSGYYWALRYGGGGCHGDARKDGCNAFIGFRQRES